MKIKLVTTCNKIGFAETGQTMAETFAKFWPSNVRLLLYAEDFDYDPPAGNIEIRRLPDWFSEWKARHMVEKHKDAHGRDRQRNRRGADYDFRRDCVKFAHKVAALIDAAEEKADLLIWADADTLSHARVTEGWLAKLMPGHKNMAWLERPGTYPECGFMLFRPQTDEIRNFMRHLQITYASDLVFTFEETHDSFVIQKLVGEAVKDNWFSKPYSLSAPKKYGLYVFHYSPLGACLDHAKGGRKKYGRTPKGEVRGRKEAHWA